ncbi:MAG: hypothetical protein M3072_10990 [Candidatus Dormibacteraeota bacterium]|nr:hypothetical protein [Candidatus Dormibacteraeota bacterium]
MISGSYQQTFRGEPTSRRALFVELERPALQSLPATRYEFASFKMATVNIDYHIASLQSPPRGRTAAATSPNPATCPLRTAPTLATGPAWG